MGLDELRRIIVQSDRGDWNVISCFASATDGPSYLFSPWLVIDPDEYPEREHHARASYRPDLSIGLAWGMHSNDDYQAEWVQKFSDTSAHSGIADVLYNGMLVDRQYYVVVDEGRASLPIPRDLETMLVPRWYRNLVKLLDEFDFYAGVKGGVGDRSPSEFDDYFRRAGLTVD